MATKSLEDRVTALEDTVAASQGLSTQFAAFQKDFVAFQDDVKAQFEQIDARFGQIDARFDRLERFVRDENERVYARMRMLNEELVTRIKTIGEGPDDGGPVLRHPRRKPKR